MLLYPRSGFVTRSGPRRVFPRWGTNKVSNSKFTSLLWGHDSRSPVLNRRCHSVHVEFKASISLDSSDDNQSSKPLQIPPHIKPVRWLEKSCDVFQTV